jgi:hypothetical protein
MGAATSRTLFSLSRHKSPGNDIPSRLVNHEEDRYFRVGPSWDEYPFITFWLECVATTPFNV